MAKEMLALDGGPVRTPAFEAGIYMYAFSIGATPTEVKDDANIIAVTRTNTGEFTLTFTDLRGAVIVPFGEPVLVTPDAAADNARVTSYSAGNLTTNATIVVTTYDGGTASHTTVMDGLTVIVPIWIQRMENEA